MHLFVTGGAGFVGSHFVEAAERAGHTVDVVDCLNYAGRSANLAPGRVIHGRDVADLLMMRHLIGALRPDAVVHLAAESHVGRSIESRDDFLRTNVLGTYHLLEAALEYWRAEGQPAAFRFLHVSTDEVYGSLNVRERAWTEASPYRPNNPYAASKAASDHLVRSYMNTFGLPAIITHSSNNYGPRQHPEKLIPTLIDQALRDEPMTLHGNGENVRDWLHVDDHCAGLLRALALGAPGETYNFGGLCERTNLQIATLIDGALTSLLPDRPFGVISFVPDRPGNDGRYSTNVQKVSAALGWRPGPPINERIAQTVRWYVENPNYEMEYGR